MDSDLEMLSAVAPVPGNMDDDEVPRDGKDDLKRPSFEFEVCRFKLV
jgi:hypothetical protein